jgi:hypothetical protein
VRPELSEPPIGRLDHCVATGAWHHVAVVMHDGSTFDIYIDGDSRLRHHPGLPAI